MTGLQAAKLRDSVLDFLVGHHPESVRDRSYVPPDLAEQHEAGALVPRAELGAAEIVLLPGRARRRSWASSRSAAAAACQVAAARGIDRQEQLAQQRVQRPRMHAEQTHARTFAAAPLEMPSQQKQISRQSTRLDRHSPK